MRQQNFVLKLIKNSIAQFISCFITLFLLLWIISCSNGDSVTGGTTIGNPCAISGIIVDSRGAAISNVKVDLLPADFNPLVDLKTDSSIVTDDSGRYEIADIYEGEYVLNGFDEINGQRVYVNVTAEGLDKDLGMDTLLATGIISAYVPSDAFDTGRFLYIPGTELYSSVTSNGYTDIVAPAGRVDLAYYDTIEDYIVTEGPNFVYIPVSENDTLSIISHEITLADKPEGPTTPNVGDTCTYLIRNAKTTLEHPVEYRFRYIEYTGQIGDWWVDSDTTNWSPNSSIIKVWPKAAEYKIQAQARSSVDTTVISIFYPTSNYLKVIVIDTL